MIFHNLTPHAITVYDAAGGRVIHVFEPAGQIARCESTATQVAVIDGISIHRTTFGPVTGLPEPGPDTVYIVSSLVAQSLATSGRNDVLAPDTGPDSVIRDEAGRIIGVRRFQVFG